mgnify:CR=1 FL=1
MGYLDQRSIYEKMSMMDVLLMPYQKQVSIGIELVDTSRWMSPMKMFEYMSSSVPIISSNLPVLREVLVAQANQPALSRTPAGLKDFVAGLAKVLTLDKVAEINRLFDESIYHIDRNANARIVYMDTSFKVARILKG